MAGQIDSMLGIYPAALKLHNKRSVVLANNLVNANTPGFRARDMDVPGLLRGELDIQPLGMQRTSGGHLPPPVSDMDFSISFREALQGSADNNTVDSQREKVAYTQNAMRYRASMTFINGTIRQLYSAIRGE